MKLLWFDYNLCCCVDGTILYLAVDFSALQVVSVDDDDSINGVTEIQMIDEITFSEINSHFPIGSSFLEHLHRNDKNQTQ